MARNITWMLDNFYMQFMMMKIFAHKDNRQLFFLSLDLNAPQNESYLSYYDAKIIMLTCILNIIQI